MMRCFQLYLLIPLGRPLYTKLKFSLLSNLLESVYSSLSARSSDISYLGETFKSYYMPVWAAVKELRLFEHLIRRHIRKLDSKPVVTIYNYDGMQMKRTSRKSKRRKYFAGKLKIISTSSIHQNLRLAFLETKS